MIRNAAFPGARRWSESGSRMGALVMWAAPSGPGTDALNLTVRTVTGLSPGSGDLPPVAAAHDTGRLTGGLLSPAGSRPRRPGRSASPPPGPGDRSSARPARPPDTA